MHANSLNVRLSAEAQARLEEAARRASILRRARVLPRDFAESLLDAALAQLDEQQQLLTPAAANA